MSLNKKSVDDFNAKGRRVLVRCDFNVPLKDGVITDETRIVAALPTIKKLIGDGAKVILCSHLGKVKEGPNEKESLAPVAKRLSEKLGKEVVFVSDYNVTGEAATAAVAAMKDGDVILLENTRYRKEETKNEDEFSKARLLLRSLLILLMIMYVMLSVLLTELMHLFRLLPSTSRRRAAPTQLDTSCRRRLTSLVMQLRIL